MRSTLLLASLGIALLGCSAGGGAGGGSTFGTGGSGAAGGGGGLGAGSGSGGGSGGFDPTGSGGSGGGVQGPSEVFAEGPNTLYKLDPDTKAFTKVGDFQGCNSGVLDIALDKDGVMYGTTTHALFRIDRHTAVCTHLANGNYPNSLSLVPQGTVDPNEEALVGYVGNQYVRIDKQTGAVSNIGAIGSGYLSSGDIVSVIGGGTYLTVNGNGCDDCIIEVDPTTGQMVNMIGDIQHQSVFGLAFWGGSAYGFDDLGDLFQVDLTNGNTTPIQSGGVSVSQFWGAGSTTAAPVDPPK